MPNSYGPVIRAFTKLMKPPFSFQRSETYLFFFVLFFFYQGRYLSVIYLADCYLQGDSFTKCADVIRTIETLESLGFGIKKIRINIRSNTKISNYFFGSHNWLFTHDNNINQWKETKHFETVYSCKINSHSVSYGIRSTTYLIFRLNHVFSPRFRRRP